MLTVPQGNNVLFTIEAYRNNYGWQTITSGTTNNWPGHVSIPHTGIWVSASPDQQGQVRLTFSITSAIYANSFDLYGIEWFGGYPAGRRNVESYDRDKNVTFPAGVTATSFTGNVSPTTASVIGGILDKTSTTGVTLSNAPYTRLTITQAQYDALATNIKNALFEANIY